MSKPVKGKGMETLRSHPKAPRETLKLGRKVQPTIEEGLQEQGFVTVKKKGRYSAIKQQVPLQKAKSNAGAGYYSGEPSSKPYATSPVNVEVRRHAGNPHFDNAVSAGERGPLQPKRTGFWMDSRDGDLDSAVNHLISNGTSTSSDEYIGEQMSPEVLLARRYESSGAQNVAEAIKQLQESLHPTTIGTVAPIKDLGFQIRRGGLDPAKVLQHLSQGSRRYETNEHVIEEGEYEADAEELIYNYRMQGLTDEVGVKPSRARADNIRIARRLSSGRVGSSDVLASDPLDFDVGSYEKTFAKSKAHVYALHHLATSYLDADKYKGGTSSGLYKRHVELLQSRMHRHLSQAIPNVRKGFADLSDSSSQKEPLFYSNALPAVQTVASWSDKFRVIDKPDIFQGYGSREAKSEYMSWINKSLKDMEYKYDASDRGGLARVFDPNTNTTQHLLDAIAAEGVNADSGVYSKEAERDSFAEFGLSSEPSEMLQAALSQTGHEINDLKDEKALEEVQALAMDIVHGVAPMYSDEERMESLKLDMQAIDQRNAAKAAAAKEDAPPAPVVRAQPKSVLQEGFKAMYAKKPLTNSAYESKHKEYLSLFNEKALRRTYPEVHTLTEIERASEEIQEEWSRDKRERAEEEEKERKNYQSLTLGVKSIVSKAPSIMDRFVTGSLPAPLTKETKQHIANIEGKPQSGPTLHLKGDIAQEYMSKVEAPKAEPAPTVQEGSKKAEQVTPQAPKKGQQKGDQPASQTPTASTSSTVKESTAPEEPKPKTLQEAIEKVQADQAAKVDPLEAYLEAHPNMRHIAHDDDKDDPMSLWMRVRRNKQTSSGISKTTDPATKATNFRDSLLEAMTPLDTPATIDLGNRAIEGGNNIEPEILAHLKGSDKRFGDLFSPGMLENVDLPGHATTPDAIINAGKTNVEVKTRADKFYNPNKEIRNKYDQIERETYQKNWEQMQHQMYVTGARNTKLVEVIRDSNDPNQPKGRKGYVEGENYKITDIPYDEKYVNRNKEQWDREALAKQEFSKLDSSTQDAFKEILKAGVREGMGDAFEDLAKKNKISNADALRTTLANAADIEPPKEARAKKTEKATAGVGGNQSKNNSGVSGGSGGSNGGNGGGTGGTGGTAVGAHNPTGKGGLVGKPNPFSHINGYSLDDTEEEAKEKRHQFKSTKFLGFGLQGSASTWYGGVRQVLDNGARRAESAGTSGFGMLSRGFYGLNAVMSIGQVAHDAMKSANDKTVENSMNARSVGMTRDMYNANLATMKKGGYANEAAAANDIKHVALAVGGLGTGHVDRAVQIVEATRGAINFSDLKDIDRKDPNAINALIEKGFGELKQRGIEGWEASAIMEQSGLMTMQRDIDATEGQRKLNDTLANIDTSLTEFAAKAATAMGNTVAGPLDDVHKTLKDGFADTNGYLKNISGAFDSVKSYLGIEEETNDLSPLQPEPTFFERFQGPNSQAIRNLDVNSGRQTGTEFADFVRDAEAAGAKIGTFFDKLTQLKGPEYQGAQDGGNTNLTIKVEDHRVIATTSDGTHTTVALPIDMTGY